MIRNTIQQAARPPHVSEANASMPVGFNSALDLKDLPKITLIGNGPDEDFNLSGRQREIGGLAHAMRSRFSPANA